VRWISVYSLLLVDDEPAVLNSLLNVIPWSEYGFDRICTADDGINALKLMEETAFDLLITDIRMPNMDGLELLSNVRRYHKHTRFVILSAYDEFQYAVAALQLGAENYLLKPINPAELSATVEKALDNLRGLQTQQQMRGPSKKRNVFGQNLLSRWVSGDLYGPELNERAAVAGVNILCRSYYVVLIKTLTGADFLTDDLDELEAELFDYYDCYSFMDSNGSRVFIIGGPDLELADIKKIIQPMLSRYVRPAFFVAIGKKAAGSGEVPVSYRTACDIMRFRMLFSGNSIVVSDEVQNSGFNPFSLDYIELCRILREGSREEIHSAAQQWMSQILVRTTDSLHATKALIIELLLHIARETEKYLLPGDELPPSMQNLFSHLEFTNTNTELTEWVCGVMADAGRIIQRKIENYSPIINRTLQHMKDNFEQPLSIKTLSDSMGVNSSYLGYLFKKETGMYFSSYLNQIRVQASEKLILQTDLAIQEIAEKVGYTDVSYFIRVFNKAYGMSPAKYRQISKGAG
jgi:two-component system response regulator YesN